MPQFPAFIVYSLSAIAYVRYPLIFVGALVEGPLLMIACGFLLHFHVFDFIPLYVALILGDLSGDVVWYHIGAYFAEPFIRKHGKFFGVSFEAFEKLKALFQKYHARILIISKITMGFGLAIGTLMAAGASRIPFVRYMLLNGAGEPVFVGILMAFGYFFANLYGYVATGFRVGFIIGVICIAALFVFGTSRYVRSKVLK